MTRKRGQQLKQLELDFMQKVFVIENCALKRFQNTCSSTKRQSLKKCIVFIETKTEVKFPLKYYQVQFRFSILLPGCHTTDLIA